MKLPRLTIHPHDLFYRWTVLYKNTAKLPETHWTVLCQCGAVSSVLGSNLLNGHSKSCGCLHREMARERKRKQYGYANFKARFNRYKYDGKRRGLVWDLSENQVVAIFTSNCHYCGDPPSNVSRTKENAHGDYIYMGIDRIDNTCGYTAPNVVPCCKECNYMKHTTSYRDFLNKISLIHNRTSESAGISAGLV